MTGRDRSGKQHYQTDQRETSGGVESHMQRLIFAWKQLKDEYTSAYYNIKNGSIIHVVLCMSGGMFRLESESGKDCGSLLDRW